MGEHKEEQLVSNFISVVCAEFQHHFALPFAVNRSHIIDLDSSDDRKFSRHLLFRLPQGYCFANNIHCGNFVKKICNKLLLMRKRFKEEEQHSHKEDVRADRNHYTYVLDDQDVILDEESIDQFFVMNCRSELTHCIVQN